MMYFEGDKIRVKKSNDGSCIEITFVSVEEDVIHWKDVINIDNPARGCLCMDNVSETSFWMEMNLDSSTYHVKGWK